MNQGPIELQSIALPLSYSPKFYPDLFRPVTICYHLFRPVTIYSDLLRSIQTCYDLFYTCSQPFILNRERYHIDILLYIVNVLEKINQLNKSEMLVSFIGKYLNNGALRISSSSKYFIWGYLKNIIAENWKPRICICP